MFEGIADFLGVGLGDDVADLTFDVLGDAVHVLGLADGLEVVLEELRQVALQLGTLEVLEDVDPAGRVLVVAEVGFEFGGEDLKRG